jgi:hypothetical protein
MATVFIGMYFWFSLIYLIIRTLAVSLFSAEINDESKRPIEVFRSIPRESWCLEVRIWDKSYCDLRFFSLYPFSICLWICVDKEVFRRSEFRCCRIVGQEVFLPNEITCVVCGGHNHYLWACEYSQCNCKIDLLTSYPQSSGVDSI